MSERHPAADEQIALWRCLLLEHDEILREEVDELEAHVREAVAERVAGGASEEQRVADAIAAVGTPWVVAREHAKADPGRVWRRRAQRMLAGPLAGILVLAPITLLGTALFAALVAAEAHYETAGLAYALALRVGALVALVLAWRLARGRGRRVVGWLDSWLVRLSLALPRSVRARRLLVGVAVVAAVVWATPMALLDIPFTYQQGWAIVHYHFATVSMVWYAVPLVAIAQWGHCGRAALRRLPAADREVAAIWSRRVRWMLVGIVLHIIIRCVGESLADGATTLAWNALAPFEHLVAAHMVTNVVVIGCAALAWLRAYLNHLVCASDSLVAGI